MRARILAIALVLSSCAGPRVHVEDTGGAYATHFGGIPERGRICAVVFNRSQARVAWLRLRLSAFEGGSAHGRPAWTADWLYDGGLGPGDRVALELRGLAVAPAMVLSVTSSGRSGPAPRGRPAERVERCSEPALVQALHEELTDRSAQVAVQPMRRRPPGTVLVDGIE